MRLYRLKNKSQNSWWVFADDLDEAIAISMEAGHARKVSNISLVGDQTDFYRQTTDLDKVMVKGLAAICCPGHTWCVSRGGKLVRDPHSGIGMTP